MSALLRLTTSLQVRGGLRRPGLRERVDAVALTLAELEANPGKADLAKLSKAIDAGKLPANARFALQTPVMVGELENNLYPVTKGLSSNATVITTNLLNLKHGMPVQVQMAATPN